MRGADALNSKWLPVILLISLFLNASLVWGLYSKQSVKGNPKVAYENSIQMIKYAESSLSQAMNEMGTERGRLLFLAHREFGQALLFLKDYEDVFNSSNVNAAGLKIMLENDYPFLGSHVIDAIQGKPEQTTGIPSLQDIQKDLQRIIQTLPSSYDNIKQLKEPFEKLSKRK